mgnify:CR=1 FL=1|tara:strand:- start:140 stop:325 length:186 start_codon:yes stop_codon:yes gene_type:complete
MNKIKFADYNALGQPQAAILKYANGEVEVLTKSPYTKRYDMFDKKYVSWNKYTKINNNTYV